jgi:hypothetical protein
MHYIVAVSWAGSLSYFYNTGDSQPTSFGEHTHGYALGLHPLGATLESTSNDQAIYHQRLTTEDASPSVLYRGRVPALVAGWQLGSLPLDASNDDETPPFPMAVSIPGSAADAAPPGDPLVLYRVLGPAGDPLGNDLRIAKTGGGLSLSF